MCCLKVKSAFRRSQRIMYGNICTRKLHISMFFSAVNREVFKGRVFFFLSKHSPHYVLTLFTSHSSLATLNRYMPYTFLFARVYRHLRNCIELKSTFFQIYPIEIEYYIEDINCYCG